MRTAQDIAALLPEGRIIDQCGMPRSSAKRLLDKLREAGLIQMIGKGSKARWVIDNRK